MSESVSQSVCLSVCRLFSQSVSECEMFCSCFSSIMAQHYARPHPRIILSLLPLPPLPSPPKPRSLMLYSSDTTFFEMPSGTACQFPFQPVRLLLFAGACLLARPPACNSLLAFLPGCSCLLPTTDSMIAFMTACFLCPLTYG